MLNTRIHTLDEQKCSLDVFIALILFNPSGLDNNKFKLNTPHLPTPAAPITPLNPPIKFIVLPKFQ